MLSTVTSSSATSSSKTAVSAFNSTVLYLLAYLLVHGLYQLATVGMAVRLGIHGVWHQSQIHFYMADANWWRVAVLAVYGAGPAVCAAVGLGSAWWFARRARGRKGLLKLFLLWVSLHACNLVLGAMVADTFTQSGFWYVPSWLFLAGNGPNVAVAVLCGLLQVLIGYFAGFPFLQCHDSRSLMRYQNRRRLLTTTVLVPWVAGSALLALLKWPNLGANEKLHFLTMALLLVPMSLAAANILFEETVSVPRPTRPAWNLALALAVVAGLWWLVLSHGITFG